MCFLLVFSMIYSGFIKGEIMTFPASFSTEKLEYMRCLLSSPTIHDLDRCCIHYCKYRLACSLCIYDPCQLHVTLLPVLEPTWPKHVLSLRREACSISPYSQGFKLCIWTIFSYTYDFLSFTYPASWAPLLTPSSLPPALQDQPPHLCSEALRAVLPLHHFPLSLLSTFILGFTDIFPFS